MSFKKNNCAIVFVVFFSINVFAASDTGPVWVEQTSAKVELAEATDSRVYQLSLNQSSPSIHADAVFSVPLINGTIVDVRLKSNRLIPANLQQKYPDIRSFDAVNIKTGVKLGSITQSPNGLYATLRHQGQTTYIDPMQQAGYYRVSEKRNGANTSSLIKDEMLRNKVGGDTALAAKDNLEPVNKTYRIAFATTSEYSAYFGNSKQQVLVAIVNLVSRINEIYSRELAVDFVLSERIDNGFYIAPEDQAGNYDHSQDPFENDDGDVYENPKVLATMVGNQYFDIGHVLTTSAGGLAGVGVVCDNDLFSLSDHDVGAWKAVGVSGYNNPSLDSFYIDFVAHELAHQLGAEHSFNSLSGSCSGNRYSQSAYEPGSGSTIMSYAGICDDTNLQQNSDDYFHVNSILEIRQYLTDDPYDIGNSCGVDWQQSNNQPELQVASSFVIPKQTPFVIEAQASDADGDVITYGFDQFDLGNGSFDRDGMKDDGSRPIFRSIEPSALSYRYFPSLLSITSNTLMVGENYPTTRRALNFKVTARDQRGGVAIEDIQVRVDNNAGPFTIDMPNASTVLSDEGQTPVQWQVANTDQGEVQCKQVNILFSANGGNSFDYLLARDTANDGSEMVTVPNINTDQAHIKVACSTPSFFALSKAFTLSNSSARNAVPEIIGQKQITIIEDQFIEIDLNDLYVQDADNSYPQQFTLIILAGDGYSVDNNNITFDEHVNGYVTITVKVNDGQEDSPTYPISVYIQPVNDIPVANQDSYSIDKDVNNISLNVLANDTDADIEAGENDALRIVSFDYQGQGVLAPDNGEFLYSPPSGFSGTETFTYTIEDNAGSQATATVSVKVDDDDSGGRFSWQFMLWLFMILLAHNWLETKD
ncbi:hypothetical protein E2K93_00255 [Thalassotalea sp. HSM 43]|uniref:reprolysin-like metallopeptidase n=1 Tax=Thalassotalea sp. HSM 43 TaxID=2552945 RepID=UPI0010808D0C|nr:M12 family metallo-peptidase [Thalassotalea sp. HSM 43]QBY02894.1 hypothetical protein E2K93_00255 [Thalassotalea sp. HSM 43]